MANTASLDSSLSSNALQLDLPAPFSEMSDRLKIDILLQAAHKLEEKNRSGLMVRLQTTANQDETNLCFPVAQIESRRLSVEGCRKFALEIALQSPDNYSEIPAIADAFLASVPEEQTKFVILGVVLGRDRLMQWQIGEGLPGQINDSDSLHELDKVLYSIDSQSAHDPVVINEGIKRLNRIKENISPGASLTLDETENGIRQYLENRHSPEVALRGLEIVMQREGLGAFEEDVSLPTELGCSVATEMAIIWSYIQDVDDQDLKDNLLESMTEKFCEIVAERPCGTGVSQRLIDIPTAIDWSITEDVSVKDVRQQLTRIAAKIDEEFNDKAQSDVKPFSIENVNSPSDNCIDYKLLHDKLPDPLEKELKRDLFKQRATVELLVLEGRHSETVSAEINNFLVKHF